MDHFFSVELKFILESRQRFNSGKADSQFKAGSTE
jgi:hypothetical protein